MCIYIYIYIYIYMYIHMFHHSESCLFKGRSPPKIQATPREVRPGESWSARCLFTQWLAINNYQ